MPPPAAFDDHFYSLINNAGMLMVIVPLLILYIFLQRYCGKRGAHRHRRITTEVDESSAYQKGFQAEFGLYCLLTLGLPAWERLEGYQC